ncbi:hypothetical protein INS49_008226 [Diaporthe citri]|uniref:uncharacterized protein n=1 Tax=Diaporthe citri TaxID=83186 RepID=UPI001C80C4BC|nr:uncharacterized protein INS49_008226 [Diaporthe citri]KAG6363131.1 hypothetical protein INS49_008226 [Diaporthe citri]
MASEEPAAAATSSSAVPDSTPAPAAPAQEPPAQGSTPAETPAESSADASAPAKAPVKKTVRKAGAKNYSTDPALYIYTSLTAGNRHIITATSRLETILRANRVPFKAIDVATDEKARMLWGRRAGKAADGRPRKLPGLVQTGIVLGDIVEIEEWNEYGELKQHVKIYYDEFTQPKKGAVAPVPKYKQPEDKTPYPPAMLNPPPPPERVKSPAEQNANKIAQAVKNSSNNNTVKAATRSVAEEAAQKAKETAQKAKKAKLEALREKVHGKKAEAGGEEGEATKDEQAAASPSTATGASADPPTKEMSQLSVAASASSSATGAGLQSPTSGAWKNSGDASLGAALHTVQSPTTATWKAPAEETFAGARVESASAEEIERIENREAIKEEPEPEEDAVADPAGEVEKEEVAEGSKA